MNIARLLAVALLSIFLVNCSMDISVEDLTGPDFLKSRVIAETNAAGDGLSDLYVSVELRNSDDTLIVGHTPTISIVVGPGATAYECTASNASGVSTCRLRSNIPGTVTVAIGNIKIDLQEDVLFSPPSRDGTFLQIVSSAQNKENAGGYSVTSHVGPISGLHQVVGGYQIYSNTTGAITPAE